MNINFNEQRVVSDSDHETVDGDSCRNNGQDRVHAYSKHLLSIGCFMLEFKDAIREGDGTESYVAGVTYFP